MINQIKWLKLKNSNNKFLEKLYSKYLVKSFLSQTKLAEKLRVLMKQIENFHEMKLMKKGIFAFKKNTIDLIKFQMIRDKYLTFLQMVFTKRLIDKFLEKTN
jgi:hypothetical protein